MHLGTIKQIWRYPVKSMGGQQRDGCRLNDRGIPGDRGWAVRDEADGEIKSGRSIPALLQCDARYLEAPAADRVPHVEITLPGGGVTTSAAPGVSAILSQLAGRTVTLWPLQPASDIEHYRRRTTSDQAFLRRIFALEPEEPLPDLARMPSRGEAARGFVTPPGSYVDAFPLHILTTASLDRLRSASPDAVIDERRFRPSLLIETDRGLEGFVEQEWSGIHLRIGGARVKIEGPTVRCAITTQAQRGLPKEPSVMRALVREAEQYLGVYASIVSPGDVSVGDPVAMA